ncbi:hypothetical protein [Pendulispora albinea]|uniref:Uncharacterized protein n=1 Tax=Pendulispora albinea TaxID=2741071 RepID=A0ABZ2LN03_9BACT
MSALVDMAVRAAGLDRVRDARASGAPVSADDPIFEQCDLLALGALADQVRAHEVGDRVFIYVGAAPAASEADLVEVRVRDVEPGARGLRFLRDVAIARLTGPRGARVRIDWSQCGMELAQVALGFGASELLGIISDRRGLPIADDRTKKVKGVGAVAVSLLKRQELEGLLQRAGRRAEFVQETRHTPETSETREPREPVATP